MKQKYLFIPADAEAPCRWVEIESDSCSGFNDDVHRLIDCDCYEQVYIKNDDIVFLVDESGKIKNPPKPINVRASEFYPGTMYGDPIVGDVIVCSLGFRTDVDEPGYYDVPLSAVYRGVMCLLLGCLELQDEY